MAACQVFVFLDDAQYPKNSWVNRVHGPSGLEWITVPVRHGSQSLIRDVRIDYARAWDRKLLASLTQVYGRHPFFEAIFPELQRQVQRRPEFLLDLNVPLLTWLKELLGLSCELHLSSQLQVEEVASRRLAALGAKLGASHYLAGMGATAYEDEAAYAQAGIGYVRRAFAPPPGSAGLSIVDSLMNLGPAGTRNLL